VAVHNVHHNLMLTGGMDKTVVLYDRVAEKKLATLAGHTKKVTHVAFHPERDVLVSSSEDKTVRVWNATSANNYRADQVITVDSAVTGMDLHPLGDYSLSATAGGHWSMHDIQNGAVLTQVADPDNAGMCKMAMLYQVRSIDRISLSLLCVCVCVCVCVLRVQFFN
jgi:WD40 repeat protein